jgi:hypothetical protein
VSADDQRVLSDPETDALVALGEVLVRGRRFSPSERSDLVSYLAESAGRDADARALYRRAAVVLDRLAGGRFANLALGDRAALVSRHRLDLRAGRPDADGDTFPEAAEVRSRLVPDLIGGYWASSSGWAAVGYQVFPGRCGNLTRYTSRP